MQAFATGHCTIPSAPGSDLPITFTCFATRNFATSCSPTRSASWSRPSLARFSSGLRFAPVSWLTQRWTAFGVILLTDVWLWTPWFALILLAGLQSLPAEPFEAARIDAASAWRTFRYITLPMLRPVMVVCIVIRAIDAFRTFDIVWTISGGGPARATEVFSIYAYVESFQFLNLARGSAAAVIGAIIIVVFALLLYRILNRFVEVSR